MKTLNSIYVNVRQEIVKFLPGKYSQVLEIGCAEGNFATNLKLKCEYWGVEPVIHIAEIASQKLHKVLLGTFEEVYDQLPDNYFDLIICNDVIEHMTDHNRFLILLKKKMKKDSYIIGSVPNVRSARTLFEILVLKDWHYKNDGVLDKTHFRFFTGKSLRRTFTENGFKIEKFQGIKDSILRTSLIRRVFFDIMKYLAIMLTLGYYSDIQYMQFGFRIKLNKIKE